ncbi:lectin-like domain-containing protein [Levilactobacillus cerevisiae]|uniref:lectin-like domain-containing protein n=1 Tax=Levilactobacillus cerevisiae TaxID=1704076 RepID=UPI000F7AB029|nr:hypothetical protein [Levilactobacillus cerevisiae]
MKMRTLWLSGLAALTALIGGVTVAQAATMPEGLPIKPYFQVGTFTGATNSATVINDSTAGSQTQAVQLTDAANQLGTIWANEDGYYFDLKQDQKASMWMYFDDKGDQAGDGMAFVLQNDGDKYAAVSRTALTNKPAVGETMGVWGSPDNYTTLQSSVVSDQAIKNSWALEFDSFVNDQPFSSNVQNSTDFDLYVPNVSSQDTEKPHIASQYPNKSATYSRRYYGGQYYTVMLHKGIIQTPLSDGAWHHLTLQYKAPASYPGTGEMKYTFNDKDPETGAAIPTTAAMTQTLDIDTATVDPENTGQAMWGFTGSTGQSFETNQVVFEQIPGLVDASATAKIYDRTEDNVEIPNSAAIMGGDRLRLDYNLTYNSGRKPWDSIDAKIQIPTNVTVNSGTVTYADGTQETVDLSGYKAGSSELDYVLKKSLFTGSNPTATISLNATAANPSSQTVVAPTTSKFSAPLGIASADMVGFQIAHSDVDLSAALTSDSSVSVLPGKTTTVTGTATLKGASDNAQFTLHPTLNDQDIATSDFDSTKQSDGSYTGNFSYQPLASDLKTGLNTLNLYVSDASGNSSANISVLINVAGILSYDHVPSQISFTDTALNGTGQMIPREGDWALRVNDARGTGSTWELTARMTKPMTSTTTPSATLAGTLMYKSTATATPTVIGTDSAVPVATHTSTSDDDTTDATNWDSDAGMLLHVNSSAVNGTYQGEITWNLANAPE